MVSFLGAEPPVSGGVRFTDDEGERSSNKSISVLARLRSGPYLISQDRRHPSMRSPFGQEQSTQEQAHRRLLFRQAELSCLVQLEEDRTTRQGRSRGS